MRWQIVLFERGRFIVLFAALTTILQASRVNCLTLESGSSSLPIVNDDECSPGCLCKWSGGKQTAECATAQLKEVPKGLTAETQVINLTGNAITQLESREFHSKGYASLQRIFVSQCLITQVADDAFYLLTNLVELDLSFNQLQRVPSQALSDCVGLRRLSLTHNPIKTLHNDAFRGLSRLGTLELSHCQLHTVETLAFRGLKSLEFLRMAHNRLTRLHPAAFTETLKTQLYGVNLEENPWNCNCELRQLRQWMIDKNIPLSAPPKCDSPDRLQGISWKALEMEDFACVPEISSIDTTATAVEMDNATLRCEVDSQPPSSTSIKWSINGRLIRNMSLMSFGRQLYVIHEEELLGRLKTSVLTIVNVLMKDGGIYSCVGSNRAGNVSANATLFVLPREEFGPLTAVEIGGVIIGFILTVIVLLGAVYMVMQQYAKYCEESAASSSDSVTDQKDAAAAAVGLKKNIANKSNYETVVALSDGRKVTVDLLDSAKPFTDLGSLYLPPPDQKASCCTTSKELPTSTRTLEFQSDLVEAIASELEQKITTRLIENLNLRNRPESNENSPPDEFVPPPAPKSAKDFSAAEKQT